MSSVLKSGAERIDPSGKDGAPCRGGGVRPAMADYSSLIKVIAAKEHKEHKEVSGFSGEHRSFLEIFVFLCGYSFFEMP